MNEFLIFYVNGHKYCVGLNNVQEIVILNNKISPIVGMASFFEGMTLVRDRTVRVVNIHKYLEIKDEDKEKSFLIILRNDNDKLYGIQINGIQGIGKEEDYTSQQVAFVKSNKVKKVYVKKEETNEIITEINFDEILKVVD